MSYAADLNPAGGRVCQSRLRKAFALRRVRGTLSDGPAALTRQPGAKWWTSAGCFPKRTGGGTLQLRHSSALKAEAPRLALSRSPLRDPARTAAAGSTAARARLRSADCDS